MRAVFLDRDGTIIVDKDYLTDPDQIEFIPGAVEALRRLRSAGFLLVVCTNQSAIARGMMTQQEYLRLQERFLQMLREADVPLDGCYYCPHLKDGTVKEFSFECDCRKPRMGMFLRARDDLRINPFLSYAIGDSLRDVIPAWQMGLKTILVRTGKGERSSGVELANRFVTHVADDISAAADWIMADSSAP